MLRIPSPVAAALVGLVARRLLGGRDARVDTRPERRSAQRHGGANRHLRANRDAGANRAAEPQSGAPAPRSSCDLGGHEAAYHIHSLVGVKVDGQLYAPPANIGIGTTCMYWVHTHAADGIVHVEAPANVHPTLGDFLDLWEETYPDDQLLATPARRSPRAR